MEKRESEEEGMGCVVMWGGRGAEGELGRYLEAAKSWQGRVLRKAQDHKHPSKS